MSKDKPGGVRTKEQDRARNAQRRQEALELSIFQNAIRAVLGLDPLPLRTDAGRKHGEEPTTYRIFSIGIATGRTPVRGG